MSEQYTAAEVGKHKSAADGFWLIVESDVYDVTKFIDEHPGGAKIIKRWSGKDATKPFWKYHNEDVLKKYGAGLKIGSVPEKAKL
ncbi:cytochrome b5-like heme/steroid binding domain-containing protein [Ilyonectria destructans]|nr:cytochrome b5-like heme/steroid binding domain-containing protein [Ilyonectria destructans]